MGSVPASGAVFRALAENIGRDEISETSVSVTHARGWTRGASSNIRGGCAPQLRSSGKILLPLGGGYRKEWTLKRSTVCPKPQPPKPRKGRNSHRHHRRPPAAG